MNGERIERKCEAEDLVSTGPLIGCAIALAWGSNATYSSFHNKQRVAHAFNTPCH